ncbi:clathrin coat assembly protein [Encephalitozoon intestinalis ATCC 50506]|uniref:Clathrin coat assembly protein n=1 Tax=Encephalitozoon intestinalis (strain ATCC 50506) TaxID=876142 RepID=E0S5R3_ENCIT|nr:clathrin coat assembly protein [Encephalitozoon intestinalis ATCC 50506]ADM11048.1 clathrin coat assembly protein [Encephalitozoon intestinalis ATCC 50506]UTX44697.1 clathrin coat assembly protein [Encephalitozoon intestinalis]
MIEEIFIVGEGDRVLYGDPSRYKKEARYPVDDVGGARMVQVGMNDVKIGILHSLGCDFSVLEYIQRLCKKLEKKLGEINEKNVLENYFSLLRIINKQESVVLFDGGKKLIPSITSNNVYLDVSEDLSAIIEKEKTILNRIDGRCYLNASFGEERTVEFDVCSLKPCTIAYKNYQQVSEGLEGIRVSAKVQGSKLEAVRYWSSDAKDPLVMISKIDGGYILSCPSPTRFDRLEVCFPIPKMASKVVKSHRSGKSIYDEENDLLRWTFTKQVIRRERIDYRVDLFEEYEDLRPIMVNFYIKEWKDSKVRVERAECVENPGVCFWIRYSMASGRYEIRR